MRPCGCGSVCLRVEPRRRPRRDHGAACRTGAATGLAVVVGGRLLLTARRSAWGVAVGTASTHADQHEIVTARRLRGTELHVDGTIGPAGIRGIETAEQIGPRGRISHHGQHVGVLTSTGVETLGHVVL